MTTVAVLCFLLPDASAVSDDGGDFDPGGVIGGGLGLGMEIAWILLQGLLDIETPHSGLPQGDNLTLLCFNQLLFLWRLLLHFGVFEEGG